MQDTLILKTDSLLRVVTPPEQREALVDAFLRSSASAKQFALDHGINYATFMTWVQRRRRKSAASGRSAPDSVSGAGGLGCSVPQWVEAVVVGGSAVGNAVTGGLSPTAAMAQVPGLALVLPGGASLVMRSDADAHLAAALVHRLSSLSLHHPARPAHA